MLLMKAHSVEAHPTPQSPVPVVELRQTTSSSCLVVLFHRRVWHWYGTTEIKINCGHIFKFHHFQAQRWREVLSFIYPRGDMYYSGDTSSHDTVYEYDGTGERAGVICLTVAGLLSLSAVVVLILFKTPKPSTYRRTHLFGYLLSLLLANAIQSAGTVMSLKWVGENRVIFGTFCTNQGAIKQTGNVSTALWSFMMSLHLFNLLFLRGSVTRLGFWLTIVFGWGLVVFIVLIGPAAIEKQEKGPYFGISGPWCWITSAYPKEQILLEYFFEFLSAFLSFILYTFVLLRVRGNLVRLESEGRYHWKLRFVPKGEGWQLSIGRDLIDSTMLKVAQNMVWYPVAYSIILIPITIIRLSEFSGDNIPFGAVIFADVVFNLTGFINVILLMTTRRLLPDMETVPEFNTQRSKRASIFQRNGITPFTLERSETAENYTRSNEANRIRALARAGSGVSYTSHSASQEGTMEETSYRHSIASIQSGDSRTQLIEKQSV
ncbi:hypothetical protein D9758_006926 [Tetrapyrgos nigripes]|uniref:Glucose receptor Git3 N-terminal domain-containing protein n=1 Tax=Tetrapyrgos nigripes TaxID=182062 RepID=A0A8H5LUY2_9AGAR|nr:hypothetical protein D9758_006926 [Tetrapyrgos nigripes]